MKTTPYRPWAVWLALCIALLGALAPTVSHAVNWARGGNAGLIEVCTSAGPRWMALPGITERAGSAQLGSSQADNNTSALAMRPDAPMPTEVLDHCPFCLLFSDRAAPPPQAWQVTLASVEASAAPTIPQAHYFPVYYAYTPPPRGPPVHF
jgi:hypothetical protein